MSDERQQQELEESRMLHELELLQKVDRAGLKREALELASALGLSTEFKKEQSCAE